MNPIAVETSEFARPNVGQDRRLPFGSLSFVFWGRESKKTRVTSLGLLKREEPNAGPRPPTLQNRRACTFDHRKLKRHSMPNQFLQRYDSTRMPQPNQQVAACAPVQHGMPNGTQYSQHRVRIPNVTRLQKGHRRARREPHARAALSIKMQFVACWRRAFSMNGLPGRHRSRRSAQLFSSSPLA